MLPALKQFALHKWAAVCRIMGLGAPPNAQFDASLVVGAAQTISNKGKTINKPGAGDSVATLTGTKTAGQWYVEFKMVSHGGSNVGWFCGLIESTQTINANWMNNTHDIVYRANGQIFKDGSATYVGVFTALVANDIVGIAVNVGVDVKFYVNGVYITTVPYTYNPVKLYSVHTGSSSGQISTLQAATADAVYAPPAGYQLWNTSAGSTNLLSSATLWCDFRPATTWTSTTARGGFQNGGILQADNLSNYGLSGLYGGGQQAYFRQKYGGSLYTDLTGSTARAFFRYAFTAAGNPTGTKQVASNMYGASKATISLDWFPHTDQGGPGYRNIWGNYSADGGIDLSIKCRWTGGVPYVIASRVDAGGTKTTAEVACVQGAWNNITVRHDGTNLRLRVNGGADASVACGAGVNHGVACPGWGAMSGENSHAYGYWTTIATWNAVLPDADVSAMEARMNERHSDYDPFWDSVVLQLSFEGAHGSTTPPTDQSQYATPVDVVGTGPAFDNTQAYTGVTSWKGDANGYLRALLGSTNGNFNGNFTIEVLGRNNVDAKPLFNGVSGAGRLYNGAFRDYGGTAVTCTFNQDAWAHYTVHRYSDGTVVGASKNGVNTGAQAYSGALDYSQLDFGRLLPGDTDRFTGHIDGIRVTRNVSRWGNVAGTVPVENTFPTGAVPAFDPFWHATVCLLQFHDGTPGSSAVTGDRSKSGLVLTNNSGVQYTATNPLFGATCLPFNGSQFMSLAAHADMLLGTGEFTIEAWVRHSQTYLHASFMGQDWQTGGWKMMHSVNGTPYGAYFYLYTGTYPYAGFVNDQTSHTGAWTHWAAVRKNGNIRLYINGVILSTTVTTAVQIGRSDVPTYIGKHNTDSQFLNGALDSVRITKAARYWENFNRPLRKFETE